MVVVAHFALPGAKLCFSTGRESVFVELVEVVFILVSGVNIGCLCLTPGANGDPLVPCRGMKGLSLRGFCTLKDRGIAGALYVRG